MIIICSFVSSTAHVNRTFCSLLDPSNALYNVMFIYKTRPASVKSLNSSTSALNSSTSASNIYSFGSVDVMLNNYSHQYPTESRNRKYSSTHSILCVGNSQ